MSLRERQAAEEKSQFSENMGKRKKKTFTKIKSLHSQFSCLIHTQTQEDISAYKISMQHSFTAFDGLMW
jgi:gluconate kinase